MSSYRCAGKVVEASPITSGVSANGTPYKRRNFVVEEPGTYPTKVAFNMFGDKIETFDIQVGQEVLVDFNLESKFFKEKWFTEAKAYKVSPATQQAPAQAKQSSSELDELERLAAEDDLPF